MKQLLFALLFFNTCAWSQKVISTDPEENFEKFWTAYDSQYPFFGDKGIAWKQQYKRYRPLVSKNTPDDSLFQILADMVAPLHDAHVELHTHGEKQEKKFWARRPSEYSYSSEFQYSKDSMLYFWQAVDTTLLKAGFTPLQAIGGTYTDSLIQFYFSKSAVAGYLIIFECSFGKGGSGKALTELDSIFSSFDSTKPLLFDIRFNRGGGEAVALWVTGRFIDKTPKGAYRYRKKKGGAYSDYIKLPSFRNKPRPSKQKRFLGPVYLLTNDRTVSAGDLLALYMSQVPTVTIIGEPTEGSFDSFRYQYLPNGWHFSVPKIRYVRASDKRCYEGKGIPPDVVVKNTKAEIRNKTDHGLLRAFQEIKK